MMPKKIVLKLNPVSVGKTPRSVKTRRIPHNMSNQRMHWAEQNMWKYVWQEEVYWRILEVRDKFGKLPLKSPKIVFKLYMTRPYDLDGAYTSIKPLLDQLQTTKGYLKYGKQKVVQTGSCVILDDSPKNVDLQVKVIKVDKRVKERVEIEIYGL